MTQVTGYMRRLEDLTVMLNVWEKNCPEEEAEGQNSQDLNLVGISYINIIHFLPAGVRCGHPENERILAGFQHR
jgi:hypothetical protein